MRAAFVLTVSAAIACGGTANPPPPPSTPATPEPSAAPSVEPGAPAEPVSSTKKRKRTAASAPPAHDGTKPKNGQPLNPKDNQGRTVFVKGDDTCFVEVKTGTEAVDCPAEADDAAFDHCAAQIVLDESGSKCFCVSGGPKPPMPNPTPCPASAKTK